MKKKYNPYLWHGVKACMLLMVMLWTNSLVKAQTITVDVAPVAPGPYYTNTTESIDFSTTGTFATNTTFYLHTGLLEEDNVLGELTAAGTYNFTWPASGTGTENLTISAATGSFNAETTDILSSDIAIAGGTYTGAIYNMNGTGVRRLTTQPFNTDYTDDVTLNVDLTTTNAIADRPIVVQYSTDGGTTFTDMTDTNSDNEWFGGTGANIQFLLTSGQKNASTIFRIAQTGTDANSLTSGVETWSVDDAITIEVGSIVVETSAAVGTYTINEPFINGVAFNDVTDTPVGQYYAGQSVIVDGVFNGGTDQVLDYNYVAVFRNTTLGEWFTLEGNADSNTGNDISVSGTIPTGVTLDENWDVTIEAYTGADATFGVEEEFSSSATNLGDLEIQGGSVATAVEFTGDGDRGLMTPELYIGSTTNAYISFNLSKLSSGLSPDGTEIVLEYSTDGSTYTQIGDDISLNDDLSEALMFESLPAGIVSSTTQIQIRQLSNAGAGLSTWSVDDLMIVSGGSVIPDGDSFTYTSSAIDVLQPTIVLDAVAVPADLIYPGSSVDLVYNITNGALPTGTEISAILDNGVLSYEVGTSANITPGDTEDHTISITIPSIVGGDYDVYLMSSTNDTESNTITVPVYNTTLEITEITSNSGVTDGGVDVFFPGSEITVNYNAVGDMGAGAELKLEVRDYDLDVSDNDGYVTINSETTLSGSITGTLSETINYDDDGAETPYVRIKIGNGVLVDMALAFVKDTDDADINGVGYSESVFDFDMTEGNDPLNEDDFIGSGQRSATTLAFDLSNGGIVSLGLTNNAASYNGTPQDVYLQASINGTDWTTIDDQEYANADVTFSSITLPQELWGDETWIRVVYNMSSEAAELENVLTLNSITLQTGALVSANSDTEDVSGQFRKPTVSLEVLDSYDFTVGEQFTIEYNTTGPFPANTAFAIVMAGPDNLETVIGESESVGLTTVDVTMPAMSKEENGAGPDDLYDEIKVVAYNKATADTEYLSDETMVIDDDEYFLVIEGENSSSTGDGDYLFDRAGDRSLLTDAFDLSGVESAFINFTTSNYNGISATSNLLTIPVLQVSTDAGASFQTIAAEEDGLLGDGYLYYTNSFSAEIPAEHLTSATHFRWYQALNLGQDANEWRISSISITLVQGNEISTYYLAENSSVVSTLSHPEVNSGTDVYEWVQADADTDPVFNGETFSFDWNKVYESTNDFPSGTMFDFILHDGSDFVIDPTTDMPYVIGTATGVGTFDAEVPYFIGADNYDVRLIAYLEDSENGNYFFYGDEDGESTTSVGDLDVFLRAARTTIDIDENDVVYAGSTATFSVLLENDDLNALADIESLFANLIVKDYSGNDDILLATQEGTGDITVDLLPFINGNQDFVIIFSEGAALGEVGEMDDFDGMDSSIDLTPEDFVSGDVVTLVETGDFYESWFGYNTNRTFSWDFVFDPVLAESGVGNERLYLQYSKDGGSSWSNWTWWTTSGSYSTNLDNFINGTYNSPSGTYNERVRFRWIAYDPWCCVTPTGRGSQIEISNVEIASFNTNMENNNSYFPMGGSTFGPVFENDFGRGLITTRDFEIGELENSSLISFDLSFDEVPDNLIDNQYLIFEYSIDGGVTFTELRSFPDMEEEAPLVAENFLIAVTNDMKNNAVRFRFRQEERNGIDVMFENFSFKQGEILPFDYIAYNRDIAEQALLITSLSSLETCIDGDMMINYEVRGKFGADNMVMVNYRDTDGNVNTLDAFEFNIIDGTGGITFNFPSDVIGTTESNKWFKFQLEAEDLTYEDINEDFSVTGPYSEESLEVVAPINQDLSFSWDDPLECNPSNVMITLNGEQDYFMYEVLDLSNNSTVLASLTYDPETGVDEINIGTITADTEIGIRTTAMSSSGTSCNSLEIDDTEVVELLETYKLFRRSYNDTGLRIVVNSGDSRTICGSSSEVRLSVNRDSESGDGSGSFVEWFRNDLSTPVSVSGNILGDNETLQSGNYFARITDTSGDNICTYTTESFTVERVDTPERPEITIESGSLSFCDGEGEVVLSAPEGFSYYKWNGSTQWTNRMLTVEEEGEYYVEVSNVPFDAGCGSASSIPVVVESQFLPDFQVKTTTSSDDRYNIIDGSAHKGCESFYIYFYNGNSWQNNNGEVVISRDGEFYASTQNTSYELTESGDYTIDWVSSDINSSCTASIGTFTLQITEQPETPAITVAGDLEFCEGGSATLTATAGYNYYRWFRDGSLMNTSSETLVVTKNSGRYQVEGSMVPFNVGCYSERSEGVNVTVHTEPSMEIYSNYEGDLEDGQMISYCEVDGDNHYLRAYTSANDAAITWYLDGTAIPATDQNVNSSDNYSYVYPETNGVYHAEVSFGGIDATSQCTFMTNAVTVNIVAEIAPVAIAAPAQTEFCEDEVSVTLTADAGAPFYRWYRNGSAITDGTGSNNTLTVSQGGDYQVAVSNEAGCESELSNVIQIEEQSAPSTSISISVDETDCASGDIVVRANNTNSKYNYQLTLTETGETIGAVFTGNTFGSVYVPLTGIETSTELGVEVTYADGTGCMSEDESIGTINPNAVILELDGNTVRAIISGNYMEYTWYRDGVELRNVTGTSLNITDGASYTIEVLYEGGCMLTSNSVDLGPTTPPADASGRLSANTTTYPNPTQGQVVNLEVKGTNFGDYTVSIMSMTGQVMVYEVLDKQVEEFTKAISISHLERGLYNMQIKKGDEVENIRILKN
ncbi:T9SS type A sorting domain-containing protein [Reichenbachiella ulvae]|uniref:T9SS type A sorting domain-containing protein n=1 Tax=Reichenbachiella ulvae TaxID=2980104 RepID=A0ABT3CR54_9BACT|nr:T9SS type A sorting domain-containing protein [Reichenbachiella ulvae]MCV9386056.1 T9SS type A sorting domain-containing protein [Reichenbachiella ulvae]